MRKSLWVALLLLLSLTGCHSKSFTVKGHIAGGEGERLWMEEITPAGTVFVDSIAIDDDGYFKYTCPLPYQSLYNLHTTSDNYIVLLPEQGENIVVAGEWRNLSMSYTVGGSEESLLLWDLQQQSNTSEGVVGWLVDTTNHYAYLLQRGLVGEEVVAAKKKETDSIFRQTRQEFREYLYEFIETNQGSLSTLIALYKPFNSRPLIDSRDSSSVEWYQTVANGLERVHPDNPHTLHFRAVAHQVQETHAAHP